MSDKIHQKVAEVLGMELDNENEEEDLGYETPFEYVPVPDTAAVVPVPDADSILIVDNPELPLLEEELIRIEHGQQQREVLLNRGIARVGQILDEIALLPPVYKARTTEAAAELYKAVADLSKHKIDSLVKLVELKMKMAAFTRNKSTQSPLGTGNTFVINREDIIKAFSEKNTPAVTTKADDDKETDKS
jgi:hypothetical protein